MDQWRGMSAAELGRGIGAGQIDPVALTEGFLAAIEAHPLRDRIYVRVTPERARAEARAASERARLGRRLSALDGVPVSWKDLFDSAGIGTEAGTPLMAGRVPGRDAEVLRNATALGLVCLGKTHMSEIAFSGLGLNPMAQTPPCVNAAEAVPGGSSSGAAASVAFGLAAAAVGSDTGGSVRIPAAWNDLVGLKTTHGRLSLKGVVPLCTGFDTVGPITRNVEDAALMLAALEGGTPADLRGATLEGARFAALETIVLDGIEAAPEAGYRAALDRLGAAGARIDPIRAPFLDRAFELSVPLYTADAWANWRDLVEPAPDRMWPPILQRVRAGAAVSADVFLSARDELRALRARWHALIAGYDAVLMPSVAIMPPKVTPLMADAELYRNVNLMALRNTRVGNLMGDCALSLPTGTPSVGLMADAVPGAEERLLRLGAAMERALA